MLSDFVLPPDSHRKVEKEVPSRKSSHIKLNDEQKCLSSSKKFT